MKRSTRNRLSADQRAAHHATVQVEKLRLARYFVTSVAQGDPRRVTSIMSVLGGTLLKVASELASKSDDDRLRAISGPVRDGGNALYAIAAVNEAGSLVSEVAQAIHGQPEVPRTYDVTDTPHTLSTSVANTSSGIPAAALAGLAGAGLGAAGATAVGAGAAGAAGAGAAGAGAAAGALAAGALVATDAAAHELADRVAERVTEQGGTQTQADAARAAVLAAGAPGTASAGGPAGRILGALTPNNDGIDQVPNTGIGFLDAVAEQTRDTLARIGRTTGVVPPPAAPDTRTPPNELTRAAQSTRQAEPQRKVKGGTSL